MLDREEYIEQAYLFRSLGERIGRGMPIQEVLAGAREEVLSTTNLPLAIDYLLSELKHQGVFGPAMVRLDHYFTPFQTCLVDAAESERGRFEMRMAFEVLHREAKYRAESPSTQGIFMYQFETICRNRLSYDQGLLAVAKDPMFDEDWRKWILDVRRQIGIIDFADLVYVRSQQYLDARRDSRVATLPVLFGAAEGKIALANRKKDPLFLFSALQRHLGYPIVPRPEPPDESDQLVPLLARRLERLETRMKLVEDERNEGIDLSKFYAEPSEDHAE